MVVVAQHSDVRVKLEANQLSFDPWPFWFREIYTGNFQLEFKGQIQPL